VPADTEDDVLVLLADEDHLGDGHGLLVGDPEAVDELHRKAEPPRERGDLGTAAVHEHGVHADALQQHHVARELLPQSRCGHGRSPVLDHDGSARELADVGECLE
jgi:hypothetical protein